MMFCAEVKFAKAVEVDCVRVATVGDRARPMIQTTNAPIRTVEVTFLLLIVGQEIVSTKGNIYFINRVPQGD
jgi:hypothetical protein